MSMGLIERTDRSLWPKLFTSSIRLFLDNRGVFFFARNGKFGRLLLLD